MSPSDRASDDRRHDEPASHGDRRRGVKRTAIVLAVIAVSIYGYFIAKGVFGI